MPRTHPNTQKESLISQKFLDSYDGQTLSELIAMKDEYRVDSLILAIHQVLQHVPENAMTQTARMVNAIVALETEVNNGGYEQFFINSSRECTSTIVHALELIGCPKTAEITAEAIAVLQLPGDYDSDLVQQRVADLSDEALDTLSECDSRYFESGEDIAAAHFAYLEKHQDEIRIPYAG